MQERNLIRTQDIKKIKITDDAMIFYTKDECFVCEKDHALPKP
nr:MAG TPA: Intracellular delivery domain [Caudoviricetes sp.]